MARLAGLILAVLIASSASGCAWFKAHGGPAALDCAGDKLVSRVALVVSVVLEVAKEKDAEVKQAKLAEVGKVVGFDVLACALQHVHLKAPAVQLSGALKGAP